MTKGFRLYLLLVGFACLLTGCAEALVISAVMPPKATYETVIDRNNHKISNTSSQVRLLLFDIAINKLDIKSIQSALAQKK